MRQAIDLQWDVRIQLLFLPDYAKKAVELRQG